MSLSLALRVPLQINDDVDDDADDVDDDLADDYCDDDRPSVSCLNQRTLGGGKARILQERLVLVVKFVCTFIVSVYVSAFVAVLY